jgi:lipopolysaccharide export system protein LptA
MPIIKIILFFVVSLSPLALFGESGTQDISVSANTPQKIKDFYLSNLKEDGSKDWEVKGKEALIKDQYVNIDKMEGKYYPANSKAIFVKSEKAQLDKSTKEANLQDNVELKIPDKDGSYVKVNCSGPLEMKYNEGIAIFNKDVIVDNKEGKLFSDKATVYFDTKDKTKMKIIAEGHVKIIKDDNIAFADKATYIGADKNVILEGNPRLVYFSKKDETPRNK